MKRDQRLRALLNLGHTFGHAIEAEMGYGVWLHGEAVAAGMVMAARTAELLGTFRPKRQSGSLRCLSARAAGARTGIHAGGCVSAAHDAG